MAFSLYILILTIVFLAMFLPFLSFFRAKLDILETKAPLARPVHKAPLAPRVAPDLGVPLVIRARLDSLAVQANQDLRYVVVLSALSLLMFCATFSHVFFLGMTLANAHACILP